MSGIRYAQWSRRAVLEGGLLAGLGTLLPRGSGAADANADAAAQARLPVITRAIPSTGERIPVMGIGTNQFREDNYAELRAVLQRMHELGGTVIDTAAGYGESEAVIGHVLADLGIRKQMFIATKFNAEGAQGHQGPPPRAAPPSEPPAGGTGPGGRPPRDNLYGQASFDRSLQRLQTDRVDVMFAHHLPSVDPLMPLLQELKKAGKARYVGITTADVREHPELVDEIAPVPDGLRASRLFARQPRCRCDRVPVGAGAQDCNHGRCTAGRPQAFVAAGRRRSSVAALGCRYRRHELGSDSSSSTSYASGPLHARSPARPRSSI